MVETSNVAVIRRWMDEIWNQRRDATVHEILGADAVGHLEGLVTRSVDEFLAARAYLLQAFPDFHITVDDAIAQGDHVAIRWSATGTQDGPLMEVPATGQEVALRGLTWFTLRDGKIVEGWDAWNLGRLVDELRTVSQAMGKSAA